MQATAPRHEFAPPPPPGLGRAWVLAMAAHVALLAALTWGVTWRHEATQLAAEAELWSAVPQRAAPAPEQPPPAPPPPALRPEPTQRVAPPPPLPTDADIALAREKKREELEKQKQEAEKAEARKKQAAEKKREDEQKKRDQQEQAAKVKAQEQAQAKVREEAEAKRIDALRNENLRRIEGLAGATGAPGATGTAARASGPSDSYAGRILARVKPNIVVIQDIPGNPTADVEVRLSPDGTIIGRRIIKSSGVAAWDEAVLRALDRTGSLPRDTDGRVHSPFTMGFRPRD